MRFPLLTKIAAIGLVMLLLSFVLLRIQWLVDERRMRQTQARTSVEQSLAGAQTLLGPVLHRSCVEDWDDEVGEGKERRTRTRQREILLTSMDRDGTKAGFDLEITRAFSEALEIPIDANMVAAPRTNPYVRMDGWDEEVAKMKAGKKVA